MPDWTVVLAFVLVNCAVEKSEYVERAAKKVQGIIDVHSTTGMYDIILRAEGEDESKLSQVIRKIKRIAGVTAALTSIVYNENSEGKAATHDKPVTILSYSKHITEGVAV